MQLQQIPVAVDELEEAVKLLKYIDTQSINELDPSLQEKYHISKEIDIPIQVQLKDHENTHFTKEKMHLKVLVIGDEEEPGNVRLEITSLDDIFFHYTTR